MDDGDGAFLPRLNAVPQYYCRPCAVSQSCLSCDRHPILLFVPRRPRYVRPGIDEESWADQTFLQVAALLDGQVQLSTPFWKSSSALTFVTACGIHGAWDTAAEGAVAFEPHQARHAG